VERKTKERRASHSDSEHDIRYFKTIPRGGAIGSLSHWQTDKRAEHLSDAIPTSEERSNDSDRTWEDYLTNQCRRDDWAASGFEKLGSGVAGICGVIVRGTSGNSRRRGSNG
jgi:hypothetical protein